MTATIHLTHLYTEALCIYGDRGNVLTMKWALESLGHQVTINDIEIGDKMPKQSDWLFIGGGGDMDQGDVIKDLKTKQKELKKLIGSGTPCLAICGGYQLFGKSYEAGQGQILDGINIFDVVTRAPDYKVKSRAVGNIILDSLHPEIDGKIVGFENHGGQTFFENKEVKALGKVATGKGNNMQDNHEGCCVSNCIGTYLHGPVLPKNTELLKFFITKIYSNLELGDPNFDNIDFELSNKLHSSLITRFS